jgi:hypothetical protein
MRVLAIFGKNRQRSGMPVDLPYSRIEAAFVSAFNVKERDVGRFRARVTFWQKGGALGVKPGKGKPIDYGPDQLHRLIFALELAECGATPAIVKRTIADLWEKRIRRHFERAEASVRTTLADAAFEASTGTKPRDIALLVGYQSLMIGAWDSTAKALPNVNACELAKLADTMSLVMNDTDLRRPPRVLVINLSERLRRVHAALAATRESEAAPTKAKRNTHKRRRA